MGVTGVTCAMRSRLATSVRGWRAASQAAASWKRSRSPLPSRTSRRNAVSWRASSGASTHACRGMIEIREQPSFVGQYIMALTAARN